MPKELRKVYGKGDASVEALRGISIGFAAGQFTAIMGSSGSGKSTLLHCLAGLDAPTSGRVFIGGTDLTTLSEKDLTKLRRDHVGFVFQAFNLVPTLSASENITLPMDIAGATWTARGSTRSWTPSGCATVSSIAPASSPADSSSAWRARAPW